MRMDFSSFGGGATPIRRQIDRRMRQLDIRPLDHADKVVRVGVYAGLIFLGLLLLYAAVAPISSAAVASGEVRVGGDKMVVQPQSSGVIAQVLVREGQAVRAGQPLIRLDPLRSDSQLTQAQLRYDTLSATQARLLAERDGAKAIVFPSALLRRAHEPEVAAALTAESAMFRHHRAVLRAERGANEVQLVSARAQQVATVRQLGLISDELGSYRELYDKGFARKSTVRSLERSAAQLQADRATGLGSIEQASLQRARTQDAQYLDTINQLAQVREQLAQLTPQLAIARDIAGRSVLRAPADGHVSGVIDLGPGMVVGGGKTLMELVPLNASMVVEAQIKPADIDDVRVGQPATLRFSTINPHGKTAFQGHVIALSPDRVGGSGAAGYYRALVVIDDVATARREGLVLQPGVPASVNIKTKNRTLLGYLFSPLADAISRSMREE